MIEELKSRAAGRFYYLASPYTHADPLVRDLRASLVHEIAGHCMTQGLFVYAAILATHEIAKQRSLPVEFEWWMDFNESFINPSAGVIVCTIPGWLESRGIAHEINRARALDLPVYTAHLSGSQLVLQTYPPVRPA